MKRLSILGSTGSIGRQCLNVVESLPGRFGVVGLAAGNNVELVAEQVKLHRPDVVSVAREDLVQPLAERLRGMGIDPLPEIQHGAAGMEAVATHPDAEMVLSAAVGVVGLPATYEAVKQGKQIALANKEVLVAAGELVTAAARE
ncbi:MAG: 1-deoxy-D-xylulose-5-phosphate reductoisomerase, partial [Acidobacteria bacterium]|nr:1-deoxy-D-xylulose-5-phosphate reductoisomerase [Acidobacteriota bacterium]